MSAIDVQSEVQDGLRCAVCEEMFGQSRGPLRYVREQGVMVHETCWTLP